MAGFDGDFRPLPTTNADILACARPSPTGVFEVGWRTLVSAFVPRAARRRPKGALATGSGEKWGPAVVAFFLLLGSASDPARAQSGPDPCGAGRVGEVRGRVTDADGMPIVGARVRVRTCLDAPSLSDAGGSFVVPVPAGSHVITAAAPEYYNGCYMASGAADCTPIVAGGTDAGIVLESLPTDDDPAHVFQAPETCATCHAAIYEQWTRSTKARTNRNGWVAGLYNGTDATMGLGPPPDPNRPPYFGFLSRHNVDAAGPTRNGECANCHQPEYVGVEPTNTNFNRFTGAEHRGVTCAFCHKIVDVDVSPAGIGRPNLVGGHGAPGHGDALALPAKTIMRRSTIDPGLYFGPLDDVTFRTVDMRASYGAVLRSSRLCAACHEDNADPRDANGDFRGTYDGPPSQTTYSEWAASPYAAAGVECQDCHMPPVEAARLCDVVDIPRDARQVRSHAFEGTTPEFLRRAVTLRSAAVVDRDTLRVTVDVTNSGAGHHVPTGVTLRNLVLVVSVRDRDGNRLEQIDGAVVSNWGGVGDPERGAFAGLPGRGYARVLVDEFLAENVLFTEAVQEFDNRIAAGATDTTAYAFQLPKQWAKLDIRVETRLHYRRAFKPIADQRRWNVPLAANPHGTRGDGGDYDENFLVADVTTPLSCEGKLGKLRGVTTASGEGLGVSAALKLPRGETIDPRANGLEITLGDRERPNALLQEEVRGFTGDPASALEFVGTGAVRGARLTPKGRRVLRLELDLGGLDVDTLTAGKLVVGVASGEACFRASFVCRTKNDVLRCR